MFGMTSTFFKDFLEKKRANIFGLRRYVTIRGMVVLALVGAGAATGRVRSPCKSIDNSMQYRTLRFKS